jgi:dTDP-4-amino-4,6-dideoxygalactose transaminase
LNRPRIPFARPFIPAETSSFLADVLRRGRLAGDGPYARRCQAWLEKRFRCARALLTPSGTAALEMAAILADLRPGDEVIMPSFTFPSTANAFVLRGAVPVFVDIRPDTGNLDETRIEAAVTKRTKAIVPVHYAGVGCDMEAIMAIAARHRLLVIEDAAQAVLSFYRNRPLGSFGALAAVSFQETKNLTAGEGGALLVNDPALVKRAEIIWEKGTDRSRFFRGEVARYTWLDMGSSYLPNELTAAFLWAQLRAAVPITRRRIEIWNIYHRAFAGLEKNGLVRRPTIPPSCRFNGHIYFLRLPDRKTRTSLIAHLQAAGIKAVFHYQPLHRSKAGRAFGRAAGPLKNTEDFSDGLVRLPLWPGLEERQARIIRAVLDFFPGAGSGG